MRTSTTRTLDEDLRRRPSDEKRYSPANASAANATSSRQPRPEAHLHVLRGAPEPHDADVDAPLHPPDERVLTRRSRTTRQPWRSTSCITTSGASTRRCASRPRWKLALQITSGAIEEIVGPAKIRAKLLPRRPNVQAEAARGVAAAASWVGAQAPHHPNITKEHYLGAGDGGLRLHDLPARLAGRSDWNEKTGTSN